MASYDVGLGTVEIDEADVVRVVLQYLAESGLATSAATLEDEAGVRVNAVSDRASLVEDVKKGRWAEALPRLAKLDLPAAAAADVWEHVPPVSFLWTFAGATTLTRPHPSCIPSSGWCTCGRRLPRCSSPRAR